MTPMGLVIRLLSYAVNIFLFILLIFVGASASTMLQSAEFICLRVAYRETFREELSRLTGAFDTAAISVLNTCNTFP